MKIPEAVKEAWAKREGPVVMTTVDGAGMPNSIYVGSVWLYGDERVLIADNYFDKTQKNIKAGCKGAVLFLTSERKAFQLKGTFEYHLAGPLFDDMKKRNSPKHPGHAAAALLVQEAYSGAQRLE